MAPPRRREYHVNPKSIPRARHASLCLDRCMDGGRSRNQRSSIGVHIPMHRYIPFASSGHHALYIFSSITQTLLTLPPLFRISCVVYEVFPSSTMFSNVSSSLYYRSSCDHSRYWIKEITFILILIR